MKHTKQCECDGCLLNRIAYALENIQIKARKEGKLPLDKWIRSMQV